MVPWVTLLPFVQENMSFKTWKKTQWLVYPFMALLVLQGSLARLRRMGVGVWIPSGMQRPLTYLAIGAMYLVLKIRSVGPRATSEEKNA